MSRTLIDTALIDDGPVPTHSDLQLRPLNIETGNSRFREADDIFPPRIATWRNNLTALSQKTNLFFVAYSHEIYVWEPAGPRQILGAQPTMIITPMMKIPNATGYISQTFPHAVNNLVVEDLGRDEILLLATDSGNVCGYHIQTICSEIARARENGRKRPFLYQHTDPFFCENVGASAWGLAVHKYARLIAVSANTCVITVFAFALAKPHSGKDDDPAGLVEDYQNYQQNWLSIDRSEQLQQLMKLAPRNHRSRNLRLSYKGHLTNIPNVSFFNSDLDSNGRWMLSTDIDNRLLVWDIWGTLTPFRRFDFCDGDPLPDILRPKERGWNVLALDPRSFRTHGRYTEACGGKPYVRHQGAQPMLDITNLIQNVRDSSVLYNSPSAFSLYAVETFFPNIFDGESSIGIASGQNLIIRNQSNNSSSGSEQYIATSGQRRDDNFTQQTSANLRGVSSPSHERIDEDENTHDNIEYEESEVSVDTDWGDNHEVLMDVFYSMPDASNGAEAVFENTEPIAIAEFAYEAFKILDLPMEHVFIDFPILHFSETDIRLIESPLHDPAAVVCAGPLRQNFSRMIYEMDSFDRFNMVKYLAEDGIVIAATQKGRAAIISLGKVSSGGAFTLRINWMVPLASQERYGNRPLMPLLGIAVSPIQGFEKTADVPDVPYHAASRDDISFHYRFHDKGEADWCDDISSWGESEGSSDKEDEEGDDSSGTSEDTPDPTDAECYGAANWTYQPRERWQGWNPSRRYRLLLTYADHTVLSYEFWYEWSEAVLKDYYNETRGKYPDDGCDDFLLL